MVTQNHFVIPATVLEKFRSRGFPEGVTVTAQVCKEITNSHNFVTMPSLNLTLPSLNDFIQPQEIALWIDMKSRVFFPVLFLIFIAWDELYKNRSSRKIDSLRLFSRE